MIKFLSKTILLNIVLIFIVLIIVDLFFGKWFSSNNYGNLLIPRNVYNIIDEPPYVHDKIGVYSRDKNGFRANDYSIDEINILVVGGSTTEERDVDDSLIWTKIFEKNLKKSKNYKVLNAGIGGQTSFGHIKLFDLWFARFDNLKPQFILFYIGINDALFMLESIKNHGSLIEGRSINFTNRDNLQHISDVNKIIQYFKNNSVYHMIYLIIKGNLISRKYNLNYNNKAMEQNFSYAEEIKFDKNLTESDFNEYLILYEKNLNQLTNLSKNFSSKPIFITQKIAKDHWLSEYVKIINMKTLSYSKKNNIKYINLESLNDLDDSKYFYDGIHTTPEGSKKIGQFIAEEIF